MDGERLKPYRVKFTPINSPELEVTVRVDARDLPNARGIWVNSNLTWERVEHCLVTYFDESKDFVATTKLSLLAGETVELTVNGFYADLVRSGWVPE